MSVVNLPGSHLAYIMSNPDPHPPVWPFPTYKGQPYKPPRQPKPAKPVFDGAPF